VVLIKPAINKLIFFYGKEGWSMDGTDGHSFRASWVEATSWGWESQIGRFTGHFIESLSLIQFDIGDGLQKAFRVRVKGIVENIVD
jgi:hypothetical protein